MNEDDFSWEDKEVVVFKSTRGIAAYLNHDDDIVIRQQAGALDNEDAFIVVPRAQLDDLIIACRT